LATVNASEPKMDPEPKDPEPEPETVKKPPVCNRGWDNFFQKG